MDKFNKKFIAMIVVFLFFMLPFSVQSTNIGKEQKNIDGEITVDLKAREPNGDWKDSLSSLGIGTIVEFKITVDIPRDYFWLGILVELPSTSNGPMFNYRIGSLSPTILDENVGLTYANDEEVSWSWIEVEPPFTETMTFKARIKEKGTENVNLIVGGDYGENGEVKEDEGSDTLKVSSSNSKNIKFNFRKILLEIFTNLEKILNKFDKILNLKM